MSNIIICKTFQMDVIFHSYCIKYQNNKCQCYMQHIEIAVNFLSLWKFSTCEKILFLHYITVKPKYKNEKHMYQHLANVQKINKVRA
jgi:hypothetical protein